MEQKRKYIPEEWAGKRYGHLTIIGYENKKFICRCDCGGECRAKPSHLFNGKVKTCGYNCPHHQEQYDRRSKERLYSIWCGMIRRCYNPNATGYKTYGGRGISVCDEWRNDFWAFNQWGIENGYQEGLSIDRIDCDGNYEPSNCRWANAQMQRGNQHDQYTFTSKPISFKKRATKQYDVFGEKLTMPQIVEKYGKSAPFIRYRLKLGMTMEEAVTKPKYFKEEQ